VVVEEHRLEEVEVVHRLEEEVGCWTSEVVVEGFLRIVEEEHSNQHRSIQGEQRAQVAHP